MDSETSSASVTAAERWGFVGFAFLAAYGAFVFVPLAFLVAGVSIAGWMAPLAVLGAGAVLYLLAGDNRFRAAAMSLGIVGAVLLVGIIVAVSFYDASSDGRWYHQNAVITLSDGWNPISNADPGIVSGFQYIRSYPKAFWIGSATLSDVLDSIEVGKSLHFLPLGASFFWTLALLVRLNIRTGLAVFGAGLAAANPIWILQSLSFHIDGQIAALFLVAVSAGVWMLCFTGNRIATVSLAVSLILLVNLKFTGLFYAGLILLSFGAVLAWQRRWPELRSSAVAYGAVLAVAVGVVGFNPYVQNTLDFGNPFFPVYGEDSIDFITGNTPINLRGASQPVQLYYGVFGKPGNPIEAKAEHTLPFSPANLSIRSPYTGPGARIAGFGPLFGGGLLLALAGLIWYLLREPRQSARWLVSLTVLFLTFTVVAHPEGWWARYTPQLWLIPVVVILGTWAMTISEAKWVGAVLSFVLISNLFYVMQPYAERNIEFTQDVRRMYEPFIQNAEVMQVHLTQFGESTIRQMKEAGVVLALHRSVDALPCTSPEPLVNQAGMYCPPSGQDHGG